MVLGQPINAVSHRLFKPVAGARDGVNFNPVNSDNTLSPLDAVKIGILTHHGLPGAGDAHEIPDLFCHFSPRGPAPGLKSPGLNRVIFQGFSSVSTDTG